MSVLKHLMAIILLPGVMTVAIPAFLLDRQGYSFAATPLPFPLSVMPMLIGLALVISGLTLMFKTNDLFARVGKGTLAPWTPTKHMVVEGAYRHVRNPMITGVFCILLGEAAFFQSRPLLIWFGIFVLVNITFIPLLEERDLESRFGDEYLLYKKNVPRWIPRRKPWSPKFDKEKGN
jgi:protein-S-isoprenylcysteine O-methyltransferase Ste14